MPGKMYGKISLLFGIFRVDENLSVGPDRYMCSVMNAFVVVNMVEAMI